MILDPDRSKIVSTYFINNLSHSHRYAVECELCSMAPKESTSTYYRYCTAYVVSNQKPMMLPMTCVRNDGAAADAVERVFAHIKKHPFEVDFLLDDSGSTIGTLLDAHVRLPKLPSTYLGKATR